MKVTAIVHTRNSELYLEEVLLRLTAFDEVLVCDMESTDSTLEIARRHGCTIVSYPPVGYVEPARNFAMEKAQYDWVFFVDSDELVTPELADYIEHFIANPGKVKALQVPRKNLFLDGWSESTYPDYQTRLLDRRCCNWPPQVHSKPEIKGRVERIPAKRLDLALIHKSPRVEDVMERINRYTTLETERRRVDKAGNRRKAPGMLKMIVAPWFRFIKMYIFKGGFRQGVPGYIEARNKAFYKFYTLAKLYEDALTSTDDQKQIASGQ
jgi:glycosyltransferase involved in cell wall biosynthesis